MATEQRLVGPWPTLPQHLCALAYYTMPCHQPPRCSAECPNLWFKMSCREQSRAWGLELTPMLATPISTALHSLLQISGATIHHRFYNPEHHVAKR